MKYLCKYWIGARCGITYRIASSYDHAVKVFGNITNNPSAMWTIEKEQ